MPITELAVLPLAHPTIAETTLIEKFKTAKTVLEKSSGFIFRIFQQVEDPSLVYIVGRWDSTAAHEAFLASAENKELLELIKDDIATTGDQKIQMWHLDADLYALGPEQTSTFTAPIISCNRHFMPPEKKKGFQDTFDGVKGLLEQFTKPFGVVGGWRIEKESVDGEEREEWVLFSGFESIDHHMRFAETEDFKSYRTITGFVEGFELRHLRGVEGL